MERSKVGRRPRRRLAALVGTVLLLAASCSSSGGQQVVKTDPTTTRGGTTTSSSEPGPSSGSIDIVGDDGGPVDKVVKQTIGELQTWWSTELPNVYGTAYKPVKGGFYSTVPSGGSLPPCASSVDDISGNAYYCAKSDVVAWDNEKFLPDLRKEYGDFTVAVVLAHEWGHAIQARTAFAATKTVTKENQADCFAGAWVAHVNDGGTSFKIDTKQIDEALAGFLSLRDEPGSAADDPSAHGSGFDRVSAFEDGFGDGAVRCKQYQDGDPAPLELPFTDQVDANRGGDLPYDEAVELGLTDLEDFWSQAYPQVFGAAWKPLAAAKPFDPSDPPSCGGSSVTDFALFYCIDEDYVGFDNVDTMPKIYKQGGDYAVMALLATQYGLAVLGRQNDTGDEQTETLRADCYAGSWAASLFLQNRDTASLELSPGDLDEAVSALLVFRAAGDRERQGPGFVRIKAYRAGVLGGVRACAKVSAG